MNKKTNWILLIVVLLGFCLRIYGYNWGFPLLLHADEPVITEQAFLLNKNNTFEPTFFGRPNHVSIYIHAFLYRVASPVFFQGQSIKDTFEENRPFYYGLSRIFTALIGTASIVIAFLIGLQFTTTTAIISAILFAIFPLYVLHSHYVTPDITITFLSLLIILFSLKYLKTKNNNYIIALGILSGLSVAEKYPGIANYFWSGLIILIGNYREFKQIIKKCFLLTLTFFTSIFSSAPFLFLKFNKVISSFGAESTNDHLGVPIFGFIGNLKYYMNDFYLNGGLIIPILSIVGLLIVIKSKKVIYVPLLLGLIYWVGLSKIALHWGRWGLPMYITPLLLSSIAIDFLFVQLHNNRLKCLLIIFLLISFSAQIMSNKYNMTILTAKDTRVLALGYLRDNGITEGNSIYEGYTSFGSGIRGNAKYDLNELDNNKFKYVILSSSSYGRYLKENKDGKYKKNIDFYNGVTKKKLITKFQPKCIIVKNKLKIPEFINLFSRVDNNCIIGPELKIYSL